MLGLKNVRYYKYFNPQQLNPGSILFSKPIVGSLVELGLVSGVVGSLCSLEGTWKADEGG